MVEQTFERILKEQTVKYSRMKPQDYGKLAFQNEFGAKHLALDRETVIANLLKEMEHLDLDSTPLQMESIAENLCRFPLAFCKDRAAICLLADLFIKTAQNSAGTREGLLQKIACLAEYQIEGMQEWLADWENKGYPAVHHSEIYRQCYHPHYRLLQKDYAVYFPALLEIEKLAQAGRPVWIGIDGRCGSGKTHFAGLAGSLCSCNVIHMDDFYLPVEKRPQNWEEIPGGNMDFERLRSEVLLPIQEGRQAVYRPYRCEQGEIAEERKLPYSHITILEGSYSHHPKLFSEYDLKIFLDCGAKEQEHRLREREGGYYSAFAKKWIPMEERYLEHFKIREGCDQYLNTSSLFKIK